MTPVTATLYLCAVVLSLIAVYGAIRWVWGKLRAARQESEKLPE